MCRTFTRCGCKGIKGSRKNKKCCKKVNVCHKYIKYSKKNIPREEDKFINRVRRSVRIFKRLDNIDMERRYRELVSIYRRMLIKFIITSNKERIYLKRCGIRAPKRHLKHIIEHKVFKKIMSKKFNKKNVKIKEKSS